MAGGGGPEAVSAHSCTMAALLPAAHCSCARPLQLRQRTFSGFSSPLPSLHGVRSSPAVRSLRNSPCPTTAACLPQHLFWTLHGMQLDVSMRPAYYGPGPCHLVCSGHCCARLRQEATGVCRMKKDLHPDFYEDAKVSPAAAPVISSPSAARLGSLQVGQRSLHGQGNPLSHKGGRCCWALVAMLKIGCKSVAQAFSPTPRDARCAASETTTRSCVNKLNGMPRCSATARR